MPSSVLVPTEASAPESGRSTPMPMVVDSGAGPLEQALSGAASKRRAASAAMRGDLMPDGLARPVALPWRLRLSGRRLPFDDRKTLRTTKNSRGGYGHFGKSGCSDLALGKCSCEGAHSARSMSEHTAKHVHSSRIQDDCLDLSRRPYDIVPSQRFGSQPAVRSN